MALQDSGKRREFSSGAVRDCAEGKGRCDLLPLDVVAHLFSFHPDADRLFMGIDRFVRRGDPSAIVTAINAFCSQRDWDLPTAMLEASIQYEDGAEKYEERNWELGQPLSWYIDSGARHYLKWLRGDDDEPHDRAFVWNMLGALWTWEHKPKLNDLPFAKEGDAE